MRKKIHVSVLYEQDAIVISSKQDTIKFQISSSIPVNKVRQDFAVWLFLPIAMRLNADLHIEGSGTDKTVSNALKMSQIWSTFMPSHFSDVSVTFNNILSPDSSITTYNEDTLCFYSGGIDSTYCIAKKSEYDNTLSLLTVHGMDYSYNDENKFNDFKEKTASFVNLYGNKHLFVKTNAYDTYKKYSVNIKKHHVGHIFALASCGFIYSGYYKNIIIASDDRLDQQFMGYPWGSNSATNYLFDDGITSLITENDDITRSEKMPFLMKSETCLQSLTFCGNKKNRPNNCGVCSKCLRTKLMFLASTGIIPDIFITKGIPENAMKVFDVNSAGGQAIFMDLYYCAKNNNRLHLIPELEEIVKKIKKITQKQNRIIGVLKKLNLF